MRNEPLGNRIAIANLYLRVRAARRTFCLDRINEAENALRGTMEALDTQMLPYPPHAGSALAAKLTAARLTRQADQPR